MRLGDFDEPEPDVVLADLTRYDGKRHPRLEETLLVVEVSDTTLRYDRETKLPLYAEAGIRKVWIVNLVQDVIEVHREPALGLFKLVELVEADGTVTSSVMPEISLRASDILS